MGLCFLSSSGASGGGKSAILLELIRCRPDIFRLARSMTSRDPRPGEREGMHCEYHFVTRHEIEKLRDGGLTAWDLEAHGNRYATSKEEIRQALHEGVRGKITLFNIAPNIVPSLHHAIEECGGHPSQYLPIYLLSPSAQELERRIRQRGDGNVTDEYIAGRVRDCEAWDKEARLNRIDLGYQFITNEGPLEDAVRVILKILGID